MKKMIFIIFLTMLMYSCVVIVNAETADENIQRIDGDFVHWYINERDFRDNFLNTLTIENDWNGYKYFYEIEDNNFEKEEAYHNLENYNFESLNDIDRPLVIAEKVKYLNGNIIGSGEYIPPLATQNPDFAYYENIELLSKNSLESRLKNNNISEDIKSINVIEVDGYYFYHPYTVMVDTVNGNKYFFIIDSVSFNDMVFMTKANYLEKYGLKYGEVYLNDKLISDDAIFQGNNFSMPVRDIMEALGYTVSYYKKYNETSKTFESYITFNKNMDDFAWKSPSYLINGDTDEIIDPNWFYMYEKKQEKFYCIDRTLQKIADLENMSVNFDFINGKIYIY